MTDVRRSSLSLLAVVLISAWLGTGVAVAEGPAGESASITNFDPHVIGDTRGPYGAPAVVADIDGNAVDAHDGRLRYFAGRYYWYGTAYRCGYALWDLDGTRPVQPGRHTFCGMATYSSRDLMTWRDEGFLFDGTTPEWQAACGTGCFSPLVLFDPRRKRYVLWVNAINGQVNYRVLTSASPAGPFTDVKLPSIDMPQDGGDYDIFVDRDGTGWLAETVRGSIVVQQLSSDYTDGVGASVMAVPATAPAPDLWCFGQTFCGLREAPSLFRRGDSYYLVVSDPACPYCQAGTSYYMAKHPLGPWQGPGLPSVPMPTDGRDVQQGALISPDSCGAQPRSVGEVPTATGSVYVYWSDLWHGITRQVSPGGPFPSYASDGNQALATRFWAPLRFRDDGTIKPIPCEAVAEVPLADGHEASSTPTAYQTACVIGRGEGVRQELPPLEQPISGIGVTLYAYADPDAPLSYEVSGAGGGEPTSSPAQGELSSESLSSAPRTVVLPFTAEAKASVTVTLRSATQRGCYGVLLTHVSAPDAGIYEGPVAGTPTRTRAVRILVTPVAARSPAVPSRGDASSCLQYPHGVCRLPRMRYPW